MANLCSNEKKHTPHPDGYVANQEWAFKKARRHYQIRCPNCDLWAIWKRRKETAKDWGGRKRDWLPENQ